MRWNSVVVTSGDGDACPVGVRRHVVPVVAALVVLVVVRCSWWTGLRVVMMHRTRLIFERPAARLDRKREAFWRRKIKIESLNCVL